jgi:DNA-binding MarR family transcriptional regulator
MKTTVGVEATGEAVVATFGRFRRQLGRLAGRSFDRPGISESQAEFLRLVGRNPGISVKAAADELGLAANSVSTLVTAMVRSGLLVRRPEPADRRATRLSLPPQAQRMLDETRRRRHVLVDAALTEITPQEHGDLARGLAVISRLTEILQRGEED